MLSENLPIVHPYFPNDSHTVNAGASDLVWLLPLCTLLLTHVYVIIIIIIIIIIYLRRATHSRCRRARSARSPLRWHQSLLAVKHSTVGSRVFPVAASQIWNALLKDLTSASTLQWFLAATEDSSVLTVFLYTVALNSSLFVYCTAAVKLDWKKEKQ